VLGHRGGQNLAVLIANEGLGAAGAYINAEQMCHGLIPSPFCGLMSVGIEPEKCRGSKSRH
jgi:hypothetical protein